MECAIQPCAISNAYSYVTSLFIGLNWTYSSVYLYSCIYIYISSVYLYSCIYIYIYIYIFHIYIYCFFHSLLLHMYILLLFNVDTAPLGIAAYNLVVPVAMTNKASLSLSLNLSLNLNHFWTHHFVATSFYVVNF